MGKLVDMTGVRFGKMVASKRIGTNKHGSALWLVHCDCGVEKLLSRTAMNYTKSCGCSRRDDLIGQRFGKLIVLRKAGSKQGDMLWHVQCDCGNMAIAMGNALKRGQTKSCKCLRKESQKRAVAAIKLPAGESSKNRVKDNYKNQAKAKNLPLSLSDDDFSKLFSGNCYYCGQPPSNHTNKPKNNGNFVYNGIDRLDSELGYLLTNVVSCCWTCNWMKRNLSPDKFLAHVKQIQAYQDKKTIPCFGEASR